MVNNLCRVVVFVVVWGQPSGLSGQVDRMERRANPVKLQNQADLEAESVYLNQTPPNTSPTQHGGQIRHADNGRRMTLRHAERSSSHPSPAVGQTSPYLLENSDGFQFQGGPIRFSNRKSYELKAQLGGTAYLPCTVINLGNHTVSWIRKKDGHILTAGREIFISNHRFNVTRGQAMFSDTFTLQIKQVELEDAGVYECQISFQKLFQRFKLQVSVPKVNIPGGPTTYARSGETIELSCLISDTVHPPSHVFWYFNHKVILSSSKHRLYMSSTSESRSVLTLTNLTVNDSGNYTCRPALLDSANVYLQVLEMEEKPSELLVNSLPGCSCSKQLIGAAVVILILRYIAI